MPSTFDFLKSSVRNRRASNNSTDSSRSASASAATAPSAVSTTASNSASPSTTPGDSPTEKIAPSEGFTRSQRRFPAISTATSRLIPSNSIPSIDITSPSSEQPKNLWTPGEEKTEFNLSSSSPRTEESENNENPPRQSFSSDEDQLFSFAPPRSMPRPMSIASKKGKADVPDRHDVMRRAMAEAANVDAFGGISNDTSLEAPLAGGATIPASNSNGNTVDSGTTVGFDKSARSDKIGEGSLTFDHFTPSPGEGEMVHADGVNVLEGKPAQRRPSAAPSDMGQDAYVFDSPAQTNFSAPNSATVQRSPSSAAGHGRYATSGHAGESRQSSLIVPGSAPASKHMHESASTGNFSKRLRKLSDSSSTHGKIKPGSGIASALAASGMAGMGVGHAGVMQQTSSAMEKSPSRSRKTSAAADYIASYRGERERSSSDFSVASGLDAAANFAPSNGMQGGDTMMRRSSNAPPLTPGGIGAVGGLSPSGAGEKVTLGDDEAWPGDMGSQITGFAVASSKRNADFHSLFTSVPEDDYLIEGEWQEECFESLIAYWLAFQTTAVPLSERFSFKVVSMCLRTMSASMPISLAG